jgi:hypothetical protein
MRIRTLLLLGVLVAVAVACTTFDERQWYKPNVDYTVAEFKRDEATCTVNKQLNEDCLRGRGWLPLGGDNVAPRAEPIPTRGRTQTGTTKY